MPGSVEARQQCGPLSRARECPARDAIDRALVRRTVPDPSSWRDPGGTEPLGDVVPRETRAERRPGRRADLIRPSQLRVARETTAGISGVRRIWRTSQCAHRRSASRPSGSNPASRTVATTTRGPEPATHPGLSYGACKHACGARNGSLAGPIRRAKPPAHTGRRHSLHEPTPRREGSQNVHADRRYRSSPSGKPPDRQAPRTIDPDADMRNPEIKARDKPRQSPPG
jgi:hypothetical protein